MVEKWRLEMRGGLEGGGEGWAAGVKVSWCRGGGREWTMEGRERRGENGIEMARENPIHIEGPSGDDEGPSHGDEHPSDVDNEKDYGGLIDKSVLTSFKDEIAYAI
ncbi:hypothetical protein LguiA_022107 [Lonicera macranthoides]